MREAESGPRKMRVPSHTAKKECVHLGSVSSLVTGYLVCPYVLGLELLGHLGIAEQEVRDGTRNLGSSLDS